MLPAGSLRSDILTRVTDLSWAGFGLVRKSCQPRESEPQVAWARSAS